MPESDAEFTVLDHIDDIRVSGRVFEQPANEYWALLCLWHGLDFLFQQAARYDQLVNQELNPDPKSNTDVFGYDPTFAKVSIPLLTCGFHWYAVSACQYVRTVGAIAYRSDPSRPRPLEYVKSVIPDVLAFRDKVAAHFAWATQHGKDNDAERAFSVMPPLSFVRRSFRVGALTLYVRRGDNASKSDTISPWSISEIHRQLRERYWPHRESGGAANAG